jgi:hypothetical protein
MGEILDVGHTAGRLRGMECNTIAEGCTVAAQYVPLKEWNNGMSKDIHVQDQQ